MHDHEHKAQYYETDQMGIIHHSNYIRWMEEARMDYLDKADFPMARLEAEGVLSPVVSVECRYKKPCKLGEVVRVHIIVSEYNGVKLGLRYEIREKETDELRAVGSSTHCFTDKSGHILSLKKTWPELDAVFRNDRIKEEADEEK